MESVWQLSTSRWFTLLKPVKRHKVVADKFVRIVADRLDQRPRIDVHVTEKIGVIPPVWEQIEDEARHPEPTGPFLAVLTCLDAPFLAKASRVSHFAEVVAFERVSLVGRFEFSAVPDVRAVSPNFDRIQITVNPLPQVGHGGIVGSGFVNSVVPVEMPELYGQHHLLRLAETATKPLKLPFRYEFVAIKHNTPVARTLLPRSILELNVPGLGIGAVPVVAKHLDFWIKIFDCFIGTIARVTFVHDDLVDHWHMVLEHGHDMKIVIESVFYKGI